VRTIEISTSWFTSGSLLHFDWCFCHFLKKKERRSCWFGQKGKRERTYWEHKYPSRTLIYLFFPLSALCPAWPLLFIHNTHTHTHAAFLLNVVRRNVCRLRFEGRGWRLWLHGHGPCVPHSLFYLSCLQLPSARKAVLCGRWRTPLSRMLHGKLKEKKKQIWNGVSF
jgi:hypothetical protein